MSQYNKVTYRQEQLSTNLSVREDLNYTAFGNARVELAYSNIDLTKL